MPVGTASGGGQVVWCVPEVEWRLWRCSDQEQCCVAAGQGRRLSGPPLPPRSPRRQHPSGCPAAGRPACHPCAPPSMPLSSPPPFAPLPLARLNWAQGALLLLQGFSAAHASWEHTRQGAPCVESPGCAGKPSAPACGPQPPARPQAQRPCWAPPTLSPTHLAKCSLRAAAGAPLQLATCQRGHRC